MRPLLFLLPAQLTDRWCWERVTPLLQDLVDVEYVDPPRVELASYEEAVRARVERAASGRPVLIAGASLGGYLAARVAATTSAPVAHVFLLAGLARMPRAMHASRLETADALERGALAVRDFVAAMSAGVASPEDRDPELDRLLDLHLGAFTREEIAWNLRLTAPLVEDAGAVPRFDARSTILHGTRDQLVPFASAEELAALARNARVVPIETSSHLLSVTHAAEVAAEVRAALGGVLKT